MAGLPLTLLFVSNSRRLTFSPRSVEASQFLTTLRLVVTSNTTTKMPTSSSYERPGIGDIDIYPPKKYEFSNFYTLSSEFQPALLTQNGPRMYVQDGSGLSGGLVVGCYQAWAANWTTRSHGRRSRCLGSHTFQVTQYCCEWHSGSEH